jgi:hypothetical protein
MAGKRPMKEIPFTPDNIKEIVRLAKTEPPSKVDFGIAAGLSGFFLNVALGLSFVEVKTTGYYVWLSICFAALVGAAVSWCRWFGIRNTDTSRTDIIELVERIEKETKFD